MAGHSHWSKIKRAKGATDAKRGKIWSKIARKIIIAAKNGGDPRDNLNLRYTIEEAKGVNLPKHTNDNAIKKGTANAHKHMVNVKLKGDTIPHDVLGVYDGGKVLLKPASPGTGLIAGGGVRAVLEAAGVKNVLTKSMGSNNHIAVVHATLNGLLQLRLQEEISTLRTKASNA
jgi:ribosomal protein S5